MSLHEAEHEALLTSLAAGDASLDEPQVRQRRAECDECRQQIDALLSGRSELEELAGFRKRVLRQSEGQAVPGAEERAELIRDYLAGETSAPRPSPAAYPGWLRYGGLAAAAAILVVGVWLTGLFEPKREVTLGDGFTLRAPLGSVPRFDLFRWDYEQAVPGGYFRVVVWPRGGERFTTLEPIYALEWQPTPGTARAWTQIDWQVIAYGPDGTESHVSPRVSASLP